MSKSNRNKNNPASSEAKANTVENNEPNAGSTGDNPPESNESNEGEGNESQANDSQDPSVSESNQDGSVESESSDDDKASESEADDQSESVDNSDAGPSVTTSIERAVDSNKPPVRTNHAQASRSVVRAEKLAEAASATDGSSMRDSLPDDAEKLKDMLVTFNRSKSLLSEKVLKLESEARIAAPKLARVHIAEASLKAAANASESQVRPVEGQHINGHGIVPDKVMLLSPIGKYKPAKKGAIMFWFADVVTAKINEDDDETVDVYTNYSPVHVRDVANIGESKDKSHWTLVW